MLFRSPGGVSDHIDPADSSLSLREKVRRYEMTLIREAIEASGGSMTEAARLLKVERSLLYKKMEKYGMKPH